MLNSFDSFVKNNLKKSFDTLIDNGAKPIFGENVFHSYVPNERNVRSLTPESAVLIKKKAFATLGFNNDIRWLDTTEKLLLRATKALFAYKVQQIRVFESITKYNNLVNKTGEQNMKFLAYIMSQANLLTYDLKDINEQYEEVLSQNFSSLNKLNRKNMSSKFKDVIDLGKRLAYSEQFNMTTWHIDLESPENLVLGPGTGVIELTNYSSFSSAISLDSSPSSFSLDMDDPNNISTITEHDIEFAISEALHGAYDFFSKLIDGSIDSIRYSGGGIGTVSNDMQNYSKRFNDASKSLITSDEDYIRERLRVFYLGKTITNPADGVNVFVASNRHTVVGNSYIGRDIGEDSENHLSDIVLEAERRLYSSRKMKFDDYKKIRSLSDNSFKMFHVFGGYITESSTSYSAGKYTYRFSAKDNMAWLSWSNYQKTPALEDLTGILEDPLTPYKITTDEFGEVQYDGAPELLDENKELLEKGYLSYNSGILKGQQAKEENLYQGQFNGFGSLDKTKILQHPDGFVYRWKKGIITATANIQTINESGSAARNAKLMAQKYGITPADDILANLDVANIISVLVTGQPYNIETFLEKSFEATTGRSGSSNKMQPDDPLSMLLQSIKKQNPYYGNFKPYRTITMNRRSVSRSLQDKIERDTVNNKISNYQKRIVNLEEVHSRAKNSGAESVARQIRSEIISLKEEISNEISSINSSRFGNESTDIKFNFSLSGNDIYAEDLGEDGESLTRAMLHVGSLRRIEDVRLNRDNNYLIISDQYDYNLELTPFLLKLSQTNYKRFQGDYTSVSDRCITATKTIGFEFFCNSQGHLEFRPPQWNKTPLSILQYASRMVSQGKSVIPENILSLFEKRIESLRYEIQKNNALIAMAALLLYRFPDQSLLPGYKGVRGADSLKFFGIKIGRLDSNRKRKSGDEPSSFGKFVQDSLDLDYISSESEVNFGNLTILVGEFDPIAQEQSSIYTDSVRAVKRFISGTEPSDFLTTDIQSVATAENLEGIRNQVKKKLGFDPNRYLGLDMSRKISEEDFPLSKAALGNSNANISQILFGEDAGLIKKIRKFSSERDRFVTLYKRNLDKKSELESVERLFSDPSSFDSRENASVNSKVINTESLEKALEKVNSISKKLSSGSFKGSLYDYLIEDDSENILGFGSGKRFLIEDVDIISATFREAPPEFTRINVTGDVPLNVASGLNSATDGLYFWAGVSDFDLWRQYGYKPFNLNSVPFISDAEFGSKPYAFFKMQTQKAKILQADLTLIGNEFYQPGDVVYVKSKHLLYYVESVTHSFSIGQSFQTSLRLTYGHTPGEYLPGPLDVIGQQLSTNSIKDKILVNRSIKGDDNYQTLRPGAIMIPSSMREKTKESVLRFSDNQVRFARMISDAGLIVNGKKRFLMLRVFINSSPGKGSQNTEKIREAENYLNVVKSMFTDPEFLSNEQNSEIEIDFDSIISGGSASDFYGKLKSDVYDSVTSAVSGSLEQAILPNGHVARPIKESSIITQVCYLKKDKAQEGSKGKNSSDSASSSMSRNNSSSRIDELPDLNIKCFDQDLINFLTDKDGFISKEALRVFPKGGLSQSSWSDLRLLERSIATGSVINLVEVGIIELDLE